jgi:hypothetical protein
MTRPGSLVRILAVLLAVVPLAFGAVLLHGGEQEASAIHANLIPRADTNHPGSTEQQASNADLANGAAWKQAVTRGSQRLKELLDPKPASISVEAIRTARTVRMGWP